MRARYRWLWPLMIVLLLCAVAAFAQDEDIVELARNYSSPYSTMTGVIHTIMWSGTYILLYAAALVIPLSYLQRFWQLDANTLLWIGVVWLGGMVANALAYRITDHHVLAALIAMPLIFGWVVLISTRSWVDIAVKDALRIGAVVAILCAPYLGPTWRVEKPKPAQVGWHMVAPVNMVSLESEWHA